MQYEILMKNFKKITYQICNLDQLIVKSDRYSSKPLFPPSRLCVHVFVRSFVTLQRFISLIAPEAPTALVPGAPEPRIYPRSG